MSVRVTGYTEAHIENRWVNIDFFIYDQHGKLKIVPCIEGASFTFDSLERDTSMYRLSTAPDDLSTAVKKEGILPNGELMGADENDYCRWFCIDGSWFQKVNLNTPERCGFFSRQAVADYLSNPDEHDLDMETMLSIEGYQALEAEVKKAYQYFEYTSSWSSRQKLRDLKDDVLSRIVAFNRARDWEKKDIAITLDDVRVVLVRE